MTAQAKMHTIEITEQELARVLFVMSKVNGEIYGKGIPSLAFEKLNINLNHIDGRILYSKIKELAGAANLPKLIDYYPIQKEWEAFLGIGEEVKNKEILDKIADMERELAELKCKL